jgi:hypothetical protein
VDSGPGLTPCCPSQGYEDIVTRLALHESIYLVYSTLHWKRLVNGYAGIEPSPYLELRAAVRRFPSEAAVDARRRRDVRLRDLPLFSGALREVVRFDGDTVCDLTR